MCVQVLEDQRLSKHWLTQLIKSRVCVCVYVTLQTLVDTDKVKGVCVCVRVCVLDSPNIG